MNQTKLLQSVILDIISDIDVLCVENHIEYYLLGGSAIGAIRHQGFIPWDDDLDIVMTTENYNKFITVCQSKLDKDKYYFQEGGKDWPLLYSKIRLKGTHIREYEKLASNSEQDGIFVDIFKMDNVSNNRLVAFWQYVCAKILLCNTLLRRSYHSASLIKKILMFLAFPLNINCVYRYFLLQVEKFNNADTNYYGFFYGRTRFKSSIFKKEYFGKPYRVKFENLFLPVPEKYHEYLTQTFGDYMQLPPECDRVGLHMSEIDFGSYAKRIYETK